MLESRLRAESGPDRLKAGLQQGPAEPQESRLETLRDRTKMFTALVVRPVPSA